MLRLPQKRISVGKTSYGFLTCPKLKSRWHCPGGCIRSITTVQALPSWNIESFQEKAFVPQIPAVLPVQDSAPPIAIRKWFIHDSDLDDTKHDTSCRILPKLNDSFWSDYSDMKVPLEITHAADNEGEETEFDRIEGPLSLLLAYLKVSSNHGAQRHSVYLAQHDLRDLPQDLQDDLPVPELVSHAGKGDLYSSSLWLGKSPTYTPLHRDPNPNLLMQLAGAKTIRMFRPETGNAIFEYVQQLIDHRRGKDSSTAAPVGSASFRGEEMMKGIERKILHDLIWTETSDDVKNGTLLEHAHCATLQSGQALFIPKGWWHSVKGVGGGVTASANWWFR